MIPKNFERIAEQNLCRIVAAALDELPLEQWTKEEHKIARDINYDIDERKRGGQN